MRWTAPTRNSAARVAFFRQHPKDDPLHLRRLFHARSKVGGVRFDHDVTIPHPLDKSKRPGADRTASKRQIAHFRQVLGRQHRELGQTPKNRTFSVGQMESHAKRIHDLYRADHFVARPKTRLKRWVEDSFQRELDRFGVEGFTVMKTDPLSQRQFDRRLVDDTPRLRQVRHHVAVQIGHH